MLTRWISAVTVLAAATALAARPIPTPPTPAETAKWREEGRTLPKAELLQPTLDSSLPDYVAPQGVELEGHFKGASSDVLTALTKTWIAAFQKLHPKVTIDLPPPYAGSLGAVELAKGGLDFVMVSRELRPTDIAEFRKNFGYDPTSVPVMGGTWRHFGFLDAIGVFVHKDNPLEEISFTQLDALLSSTRHRGGSPITKWGQLGLTGDWAERPIAVWGVKPWNGFEEFMRQRILSTGKSHLGSPPPVRGEWREDAGANYVPTVFPISPAVAKDRNAIGYAGLAYVGDDVKLLRVVGANGGPAVAPGYEEVAAGTYPLSRLVFVNINKAPGKPLPPALREFIRFVLSRQGQQIVLNQAVFLPLRSSQATDSRAALD
jgi:phosphate transport system substrate-binding protein